MKVKTTLGPVIVIVVVGTIRLVGSTANTVFSQAASSIP